MSKRTIKLTNLEFFDILDDAECVAVKEWRHGTMKTFVFPYDGSHYRIMVPCHHDDGLQVDRTIVCERVKSVERTVVEWVLDP
jgi:hypothetical protein